MKMKNLFLIPVIIIGLGLPISLSNSQTLVNQKLKAAGLPPAPIGTAEVRDTGSPVPSRSVGGNPSSPAPSSAKNPSQTSALPNVGASPVGKVNSNPIAPPSSAQTTPATPAPSPAPMPTSIVKSPSPAPGEVRSLGTPPVSQKIIDQALSQNEGDFKPLTPGGYASGQIQESWDNAEGSDGVKRYAMCRDCVYKVRLRQFMVTAFMLPSNEEILAIDIGDASAFSVQNRNEYSFAVKPTSVGLDTNINVYTKSGNIYPFYVRSESSLSKFVPDVLVKIGDYALNPMKGFSQEKKPTSLAKDLEKAKLAGKLMNEGKTMDREITRDIGFDASKLRGFNRYEVWGDDDELKPEIIYRDDEFTYIHFAENLKGQEFPVAYVVVDGIDELVNTRVTNQGMTLVVESTLPVISLKAGKKYLCIKYLGEKNG